MKISVITASYNYAQYIEEAINSVINQIYQDWELIIVDDGSSDNSVEIIKKYCEKDSRIKFFQHGNAKNRGLKETLLLGISHATGDWVAFLESDDFFASENLQKKVEIIEKYSDVGLIFNKVNVLSEDVKLKRKRNFEKVQTFLTKKTYPKNMFYEFFINNMIPTFSCVIVRKNLLNPENFNTPNDARLDWWLWIHLAQKAEFYYINEALTNWRWHDNSYIKKSLISKFYLIQLKAYKDVYKKSGRPQKLLFFMIKSTVQWFFIRILKFINVL